MKWFTRIGDEVELSGELKARLQELEDQNRALKKQLDALELEWSEWYDKFRLMYARLTKRIKDAQAEATPAQDAPGPKNGHPKVPQYPPSPAARRNY